MVLSLIAMLLGGTFGLLGCQPKAEAPTDTPESNMVDVAPPDAGDAAPVDFVWSDLPAFEAIPAGNVTGMLNGEAFEAKTVRVHKTESGPVLEIFDVPVADQTSVPSDETGVSLRFNIKPGKNGQLTKAFEDDMDLNTAYAFYWYPKGDGETPVTVNAPWACALEITEWTLQADTENPDIIGRVKGKVAITFNDDADSWVAGTFDGVYYTW